MNTEIPEIVETAANGLMRALALHEDSRSTVTDLLADLYDAGARSVLPATALDDLASIRDTAAEAINGRRNRLAALHQIRATVARVSDGLNAPVAPYGDSDGEQD